MQNVRDRPRQIYTSVRTPRGAALGHWRAARIAVVVLAIAVAIVIVATIT